MLLKRMETFLYDLTMDWRMPCISAILYMLYVRHMNARLKNAVPKKREIFSFLTFLMASHNLLLAVFSMYVFKQTGPFIYKHFKSVDFSTFCQDKNDVIKNHVEYYAWIFYVSKIYEVIDTVIVHLSNRPSIFLQYFHHTGAIFATYLFSISKSHVPWIFVVLNSFIHSVMYVYYFLAVFRIKLSIKKYITTMQMTQFIVGYILLALHFYFGFELSKDTKTYWTQVAAIFFNVSYVLVLFVLFKAFFNKTYKKQQFKTVYTTKFTNQDKKMK